MDRERHKIQIDTPDSGYEPYPVSIMNRSTQEVATFDPTLDEVATISYSLNKAGCIRIRLVRRDEPELLLRTLQDWTNQGFGRYELKWDGRDASGNIVDNKQVLVLFESKDRGKGRDHQQHDEQICQDSLLVISTTSDPQQIVKGAFEMRINLNQATHSMGDKVGYEVRYYIDYRLYKRERFEKDVEVLDFQIDTGSLDNGEHLITVNVDDSQDHIGSASVKIRVEN